MIDKDEEALARHYQEMLMVMNGMQRDIRDLTHTNRCLEADVRRMSSNAEQQRAAFETLRVQSYTCPEVYSAIKQGRGDLSYEELVELAATLAKQLGTVRSQYCTLISKEIGMPVAWRNR